MERLLQALGSLGTPEFSAQPLITPRDSDALPESCALSGVCPATVDKDLGQQQAPLQWPAADGLPGPFLGLHLPAGAYLGHTRGESLVPLGLAEAEATEREGDQSPSAALQSHLLGQGSADPESQALGSSPRPHPEALLPQILSPLLAAGAGLCSVMVTTRNIATFRAALPVHV